MTRDDVLRLLLACADDTGRVLDHSEVGTWPAGAMEEFHRSGVIRMTQTGLTAPCPNCADPHIEPVTAVGDPPKARYFIRCPESLRVEVTPEMCRGWEVDRRALARLVSSALGLSATPREIVADRLWRLGRGRWQGGTREAVLAVRLCDDDATVVVRHVGTGGKTIVFTPHGVPDARAWPGRAPAVIPLSPIAAWTGTGLSLDTSAILEYVVEADRLAEQAGGVSLDARGKRLVRNQVKAEIKGLLTNDNLIDAYKAHLSYTKAAEALSKDRGTKVTRDKVFRAVKAAGGPKAVLRDDDSASVARSVASQRRDRAKKTQQYRS